MSPEDVHHAMQVVKIAYLSELSKLLPMCLDAECSKCANDLLKSWPRDPHTGALITGFGPPGMLANIERAAAISAPIAKHRGMLGTTVPAEMPLDELHNLRVLLDQQIHGGEAITGIKDRSLIALRGAITDAIETGVKKDPQLLSLWRRANDFTKTNAPKFQDKNIALLFRDPQAANFIGDEEFMRMVGSKGDFYAGVQKFFGPASDEMRLINHSIADQLLRKSQVSDFGPELDPQALLRNMSGLRREHGGIFEGVFGKHGDVILDELKGLEAGHALEGRKISASELMEQLDPRTAARPSVSAMIQSQRDTEKIYDNNIIKRFVKGEIGVDAIRGEDFVNKWLDSADLSKVKEVIGLIEKASPETAEQLARKTIQKFFTQATHEETPEAVLAMLQGGTAAMPSGTAMGKLLGNADKQAKLKAVLGEDRFGLLKDFVATELLPEEKKRLAAGTGILTRGGVVRAMLQAMQGKVPAGEVKTWVQIKALSYLLASPTTTAWLSSSYKASDMPDLIRTLVTSEPFLAAVADDLKGDSRAFELLSNLKHWSFGHLRQPAPVNRSQGPGMSREEFLQRAQP